MANSEKNNLQRVIQHLATNHNDLDIKYPLMHFANNIVQDPSGTGNTTAVAIADIGIDKYIKIVRDVLQANPDITVDGNYRIHAIRIDSGSLC